MRLDQARNQRGLIGQLPPPKFLQTYVFVWCSNKLLHFAAPAPRKYQFVCGPGSDRRSCELSDLAILLRFRYNGTGIQRSQCMQYACFQSSDESCSSLCYYEVCAKWKGGTKGHGYPMHGDIQRVKFQKVHFIKIL